MKLFKFLKAAICVALSSLAVSSASADTFPSKPISIIVPFAVGGPTDKIARDFAETLRKTLGQPVVVENVGGAGGMIGAAKLAKSAANGYTLLVHHIGLATSPALYKSLPYKAEEFEFLGLINEAPSTLITKPGIPAKNLQELQKYIADNKSLNMANAGIGSASHLCGLLIQDAFKSSMAQIPYKGTGPAMTDLMGGQVDVMCEQAVNATPQIEAKKVNVYGITSMKRGTTKALAQVPTLNESGLKGFNFTVWHGFYAPKGTPSDVVKKLNGALQKALKDAEFVKRQEALGAVVITDERLTPEGHKKFFASESARLADVIRNSGLKPE